MISIIHYISAGRRLKESEKTVYMMGGEDECQPMLLAQRDMIKLERDFYREESIQFILKASIVIVIFLPVLVYYGVL
jgi:hypothetical protein